MPSAASITIEGMPELEAQLKALGLNVHDELIKAGERAMKMRVERRAKEILTENDNIVTGALKADVHTEVVEEEGETIVKTGTTMQHGVWIEYGTGVYAENGQGRKTPWYWTVENAKTAGKLGVNVGDTVRWIGSHPHPFLRPALDQNRDNVIEDIKESLIKKITV